MDVKEDPLLQEFIKNRGLKKSTIMSYCYSLRLYQKTTNLTPTILIEEAEDEEEQNIRKRRRKITKYLNKFLTDLEDSDYTVESINKHLINIRSFYRYYDIELPYKPKLKKDVELKNIPSLDDIRTAISKSNQCFQAIIILMCCSAMGKSEITSLTIQDLLDSVSKYAKLNINDLMNIGETREKLKEKQVGPLTWEIRRIKTDFDYVTFSTPESLDYILRYLASKPAPETNDTRLFLNTKNQPFIGKAFNQYFRDLNSRCGWGKEGKMIYFRSHNLRKWFANQLENSSLGYMNTRKLMGHKVHDDTARRYFGNDYDYLYDLYYENISLVSIYDRPEVHNTTPEKIKEQAKEIEDLKKWKTHIEKLLNDNKIEFKD